MSWDASSRNARPTAANPIVGSGDLMWAEPIDITGAARVMPLEAGCYDQN